MFQAKFVEKSKHTFYFQEFLFKKSCHLWYNVEHYGWARQATCDNMIRRIRFRCWINKATNALRTFNASCFCTATMDANVPQCCVYTYIACLVYINKLPLEFDRELCGRTKGKLTPVHATQACEYTPFFLILVPDTGEQSASRSSRFTPGWSAVPAGTK
jgi:hypothetical protein